ncbi:JAB domain-containing protein [Hufsiella ginkgonis]|uniref:DNA repair protein n=1 Tax=Hufsiella ginkgonis TaxID=2695274 RepID=A0A7K1Y3B5_9SPHI|nr:JAB domain-containing protein [Hufsiella ginkgonis]MXV17732.1 DNA repair protein [Hufsiella ginkgonis]
MVQNHNPLFAVAEVQLSYNTQIRPSDRPKVAQSRDIYEILKAHWENSLIDLQEVFKVLLLNRANRVLGIYNASSGGMSGTIADPKLIFAVALKAGASSIVLAHNHPSGNLKPSKADIQYTNRLVSAGALLDIAVLDHLILTSEGYFSFADEGMI